MEDTNAQLDTGDADLTVEGDVTLSDGKLESTGSAQPHCKTHSN